MIEIEPIYHKYGNIKWVIKGTHLLHREDGPAVEFDTGGKEWYNRGQRHRIGAPAVTSHEGYQGWWEYDKRHREDGPAVVHSDKECEWWLNDSEYLFTDWVNFSSFSEEEKIMMKLKYA